MERNERMSESESKSESESVGPFHPENQRMANGNSKFMSLHYIRIYIYMCIT